jgi:hypothetical protein
MKIGDLVKYMSRVILIVDMNSEWAWGIELGETRVAKYKRHVLKGINESR